MTWRLRPRTDIPSATDGELVAAVEWMEGAAIVSGSLALVGVALELAIAIFRPAHHSLFGHGGPVIADVFITLGILGVLVTGARAILYQGELTSRSNRRLAVAARIAGEAAERAANANARAAEANERARKAEAALEEFRAAHDARK